MTKAILRAAATLSLLLSAWQCGAAELVDKPLHPLFNRTWIATSTTAMGITGDAFLTPATITFDGRVRFHLRHLSQVIPAKPHPWWGGGIYEFSLYEILDPRPEEIRQGNGLCGSTLYGGHLTAARYVAVGAMQRPDNDEMMLLVFDTPGPPDIEKDGACGGFGYFAYPVLRYEPAIVRVAGYLVVDEFRERDKMTRTPKLILDRPVAIEGDPNDQENFPSFGEYQRFYLVVSTPDVWAKLGRRVVLEGTLSAIDPVTVVMTVKRLVSAR